MKQNSYFKIIIFSALILGIGAGGYLFYTKNSSSADSGIEVVPFQKKLHMPFLRQVFKDDYYWLVENPYFSLDFMIEHMTPKRDPKYFGKSQIKILINDGEPVAFISYYMKTFYEGFIHFLDVPERFRRKGYASRLMHYAIDDLFGQGAKIIKLDTRTNDEGAIALYEKVGFKNIAVDDGFISFELRKKK